MTIKWVTKTGRTRIIGGLTLATLIGGGWYWYSNAAQRPQGDAVRPIAVIRGNIEEVITSQGKLEAKQYVDVGTQVSGQLKKIHVNIGDSVTKGQLLAEIDPRVYQAQVEAGEAHLNSLRAQLIQQKAEAVLAEQNLKRNQNLIAVNAVSQQALQETESQAAVARAQVEAITAQMQETESNLKASRTNLGYTKIYAPMAGSKKTYSFDRAAHMVLDSFRSFDPRVAELAQRVFDQNHLDSEIRKGKRAGAFCASIVPEMTPYVLVNYQGNAREVATLARMIVAAGRAVLELWYDGALTREEAVRDTTRGVSALLQAFTRPGRRRRP